ncbi:MAG: hypothetical protein WCB10_12040 [Steroidobacteraceae bacterium]
MAAISYSILAGGTLQTVTAGTNAPSGGVGSLEIRIDQTAGAVTDASHAGGTRQLTKGEVVTLLKVLEEYLIQDTTVFQT